jgi:Ca2+-binding EF-hand superfamily protein
MGNSSSELKKIGKDIKEIKEEDILLLFKKYDTNHDEVINRDECLKFCKGIILTLKQDIIDFTLEKSFPKDDKNTKKLLLEKITNEYFDVFFNTLDSDDQNGTIDKNEFLKYFNIFIHDPDREKKNLLEKYISNPNFESFLYQKSNTNLSESFMLYKEIMNYKKMAENDSELLVDKAKSIYDMFLENNSSFEVTIIGDETKVEVLENIKTCNPYLFDKCQNIISNHLSSYIPEFTKQTLKK